MGAKPPLLPAHLPYHPFWLPCALGLSDNLQYGRLCLNSGNFHMLLPLPDLFFPLGNPTHFSRVSTNVSSSRKHFLFPKLGSLFYTSSEHLFAKHIYTSFCLKNDVRHKCSQSVAIWKYYFTALVMERNSAQHFSWKSKPHKAKAWALRT